MLYIKRTLFRSAKAKSGMATILGMLFFVGILFTCVIPLFLYVNEVNSYYDRAVVDMRQLDQDREREMTDVYAYPISGESGELNIHVKNRSPLPVKITRVWINDNLKNSSYEIPAMAGVTIESINITEILPEDPGDCWSFYIKLTTNKGNSFSSLTNPLYYTVGETGEGAWSGGMGFTIQIVIQTSKPGTRFFHIEVTNKEGTPYFTYQADLVKRPHESSCFTAVTVVGEGDYSVAITEGDDPLPGSPFSVTLTRTKPSDWVYADAG